MINNSLHMMKSYFTQFCTKGTSTCMHCLSYNEFTKRL